MSGFCFLGIGIGFGFGICIETDFLKSIDSDIFLHTIASSTQSTEHCCNAVQHDLLLPAFSFRKRFPDHQNILDGAAFKGRTTSDFDLDTDADTDND
jgi:hypothetical protein